MTPAPASAIASTPACVAHGRPDRRGERDELAASLLPEELLWRATLHRALADSLGLDRLNGGPFAMHQARAWLERPSADFATAFC